MLSISSEKEDGTEEKNARYTRKEYSYSSFSRSFALPELVNQEKIEASYEDGLLKLTLPKKEEAKRIAVSKHITVKLQLFLDEALPKVMAELMLLLQFL
jgi:HSP20 family protein